VTAPGAHCPVSAVRFGERVPGQVGGVQPQAAVEPDREELAGCVGLRPLAERRAVGVCRFRFPQEVITLAVRWYLRHRLAYRDVQELLGGAGSRSAM
jgi:hypothetical protein